MNIGSENITQLISSSRFKIDEFKDNANYLFNNGYMLWGGINGLVIFSPEKSENKNSNVCPCLTNIFIDNKQLNPGEKIDGDILLEKAIQYTDKIILPYNKNTLELQFSGMDFSNTKGIVYRYYLDGYDNNPVVSNKPGVRYTKIPYGSYKFHLNASVDGVHWCDKDVVLQIKISPPFWLSIYAVLFYIILALAIGYLVYRFVVFRFKLQSQIKIEQIKSEQTGKINDLKLQFFTNISHELRTPLNLIINPIDSLVSDPEMNSVQLKLLKMVQHNTNRLQKLINQLLDFRKIEAGVLALTLVKADILPFIHDVYRSFDDVARNKAINYRFSCSEALLECIFDPDKIEKILYNLLSNALKFTPPNGIVILTVSKEISYINGTKNNSSEFLRIEVSDTGIGIKKENQDKIFQYFYQSEQNKLEKNVGTGIGLAYINNVVKVHHGSITFESQHGEGTKFTVLLPLDNKVYSKYNVDEKAIPTQSENLENEIKDFRDSLNGQKATTIITSTHKKTVLIVDDNEELLSYLRIELSNEYNTLIAINGLDGIEKAKEHIPDLIISDLMMPEMDGIQMCKILKTQLETCHIPIIILTAKADEASEKEGLETGADEYLLKPIKTNLLRLRVRNLLETKSKIYAHINLKADAVEFQHATRTKDQELLDKVAGIIKQSLDATELDIMELSKVLGMSRSALYKRLKQITGMSTTEYVRFVKLNEAVHLFKQNKYSIEQVTFMVGFSDTKYFRKCFKLVFGSSPSEYIKKMKDAGE
jgi:signal transduction histidine kinase/DNA-binding response OmpR family regulator